ncbi:MAG: PD-(D/E)XK nuclease domain-containing protein, partial [Bacteroides sp.]
HVYNPFSLLNVLQKKQLRDYWYATGTPTFLVKYLRKKNYFLPDLENDVEMGASGLQTSPIEAKSPIPILFQAGYLTIREYRSDAGVYRLGFPNEEVRYGFLKNLLQTYATSVDDASTETAEFLREIRAGQVDDFMERLEALIAGIPYDTFAPEVVKYRERDAQVAVYLVFSLMGQFIQSEVHSVIGRADAVVHTKEVIYIFEFKLEGTSTPKEALAQIETKSYATPYQKCGKRVVGIGVNFDPEKRNIGGWVTKILGEERV